MTDKQIIIDGVDVVKCRYFTSKWDFNNCGHICKGTECKYKRLWFKKQLKRKEQEYEELKKTIMYKCPQCGDEYLSPIGASLYEENYKLKQTLAEIKEIAKNMNKECFYDDFECKDCDMKNGCTYYSKKQILQKISECEVK